MPNSQLNDVSVAIGRLTEASDAGQRQRAELFTLNQKTMAHITDIKEILATMPVLIERVNSHDRSISALNKFKNKAIITVAAVGGGGGALGSQIVSFIKTKLGG